MTRPAEGKPVTVVQPLSLQYGLALREAYRIHMNMVETCLKEVGTTLAQWAVLRAIELQPGASGAYLAAAAFVTPQSLGQVLGRVEKQGLIERRPGRGRIIEHYLTDDGVAQAETGAAAVDAVNSRTLSVLNDDEVAQLIGMLHRLRNGPADGCV